MSISANEHTYPLFRSSKTSVPVPYRYQWQHDALVQATLSPAIARIERLQGEKPSDLREFAFATAGVRSILHSTDPNYAVPTGFEFRYLDRDDVLSAPRAEAARQIWQYRKTEISFAMRADALRHMFLRGATNLIALVEATEAHAADDPFSVLRLVCDGVFGVDLERGIMPDVSVRRTFAEVRHPAAICDRRSLPLRPGVRPIVNAVSHDGRNWSVRGTAETVGD